MVFNFLFSVDDKYSMQLCVCIVSLAENNLDFNKRVYIIDNGISELNLGRLLSLRDRYVNLDLIFLDGSFIDSFFHELSLNLSSSRLAMFGRVFVDSLVDDGVDRILYLDCDTIVNDDVSILFNFNLEDMYVGAVLDRVTNILAADPSDTYFNSGVLLINLKKWREDNLEERILNVIKKQIKSNHSILYDQPILNRVLRGGVEILPLEYNYYPFRGLNEYIFYRIVNYDKFYSLEEFNQIKVPCIVHFYSLCKPWYVNSMVPFRDYFLYYKSISPFSNLPLEVDGRLEKLGFKFSRLLKIFLKNPKFLALTKYYFIHKFKKSKYRLISK